MSQFAERFYLDKAKNKEKNDDVCMYAMIRQICLKSEMLNKISNGRFKSEDVKILSNFIFISISDIYLLILLFYLM